MTAVWVGAAATIGGALIGAKASSKASKAAAQQQSDAAAADRAYQEKMFDKQIELQKPWRDAGIGALGVMTDPSQGWRDTFDLSKFEASPEFNNRLLAGQQAIERSAALRGQLQSGTTLKAIDRFNQQTAADEYQRARGNWNQDKATAWDRMSRLAGYGTGATTGMASDAGNLATGVGNTFTSQGNAGAAGTVGAANAWTSAANTIGKGIGDITADWYKNNKNGNNGNTVSLWDVVPLNNAYVPPAGP